MLFSVFFCSVLRKHDRERQHVAWEPQGIGTELAVKHVCTHQTRVDSKKHSVLGKFFGYKERHSATSAAKRDLQPHSQARPSLSSACVLRDRPSCFVRKPSTLRFSTNHFYPFQCAVLSLQTYYRYTFHIHKIVLLVVSIREVCFYSRFLLYFRRKFEIMLNFSFLR